MKIKKIILPIVLLIACSLTSTAQTQYEYAVITYHTSQRYLSISIKGEIYKEINVGKNESKGSSDANPAILEVQRMNEEGWEVFEANSESTGLHTSGIHIFFLRREKK